MYGLLKIKKKTTFHIRYELGAEDVFNGQGKSVNDLILLHDMTCQGTEKHIEECEFEDHNHPDHIHDCVGTEQAGLKCRKTEKECEEFEFHCANQECIHVNNLCDGKNDCRDGSDEDHSRCSKQFQVCVCIDFIFSNIKL